MADNNAPAADAGVAPNANPLRPPNVIVREGNGVLNVAIAPNRILGGANGQNNLVNMRDRLFHAIYFKAALVYAQVCPRPLQLMLEYFILIKALALFFALVYLHNSFIKHPATCLQHVKDWPKDGVLRVEVIPNLARQRAILAHTLNRDQTIKDLRHHYYYGIGPQTKYGHDILKKFERTHLNSNYKLSPKSTYENDTFVYYLKPEAITTKGEEKPKAIETTENVEEDEKYVVEYSLEYGHLRLSPATRQRLKIPVLVVQLDPMNNKCFGDKFSRFLLHEFLGYDDLLMASVRAIAEKEDNKGFLRNVVTGEHYRFVSMWWAAWSSYPTAFLVMILFTFSISLLLRFSHHQIFVFIVDLLQMLEFNVAARFPIAPLLTVILALVGMEAIMSEFFNDSTTAFYIILTVWIADQFDAICCHTRITKRHWLKFFFLYHFAFYAYHHRFSGQNRGLALVSSWFFIQHSMFYFFHRYELPVIIQQAQVLLNEDNQDGRRNLNLLNNILQRNGVGAEAQNEQGLRQGARHAIQRLMRRIAQHIQQNHQQRIRGNGIPVRIQLRLDGFRRLNWNTVPVIANGQSAATPPNPSVNAQPNVTTTESTTSTATTANATAVASNIASTSAASTAPNSVTSTQFTANTATPATTESGNINHAMKTAIEEIPVDRDTATTTINANTTTPTETHNETLMTNRANETAEIETASRTDMEQIFQNYSGDPYYMVEGSNLGLRRNSKVTLNSNLKDTTSNMQYEINAPTTSIVAEAVTSNSSVITTKTSPVAIVSPAITMESTTGINLSENFRMIDDIRNDCQHAGTSSSSKFERSNSPKEESAEQKKIYGTNATRPTSDDESDSAAAVKEAIEESSVDKLRGN